MSTFRRATHFERSKLQSSKLGSLHTTADEISSVLGTPRPGSDDGKTDAEWCAVNEQGEIIWIWNWKDGRFIGREFDPSKYRYFSVWHSDPIVVYQLRSRIAANRSSSNLNGRKAIVEL